jgi:hypothetical protein
MYVFAATRGCRGLLALRDYERRSVVAERFGAAVDELVYRYTDFESPDLHSIVTGEIQPEPDVLTMRLAGELEDMSDHAIALHGDPGTDDLGARGSYVWRRDAKIAETPDLLELAQRLGLGGIRRGLEHWLDFSSTPSELADMRTGWVSSVFLSKAEG